jgi:hypothetical protein
VKLLQLSGWHFLSITNIDMFQSLLLDSQIVKEVPIVVLYLHKNGNFNRIYLER